MSLYADGSTSAPLWRKTYPQHPIDGGYFALILELDDESDPIDPAWLSGEAWVGVAAAGGVEFQRQRLVDVPSATVTRAVVTDTSSGPCADGGMRYTGATFEGCMNGAWHDLFGSPPEVDTALPAGGSVAGGTTVTLTGERFAPGAQVLFGGASATSVTVSSETSIQATSPVGLAGTTVDLVVVNPDGRSDVLRDAYSYGGGRFFRVKLLGGTSGSSVISLSELQLFDVDAVAFLPNDMTSASTPAPKTVTWTPSSYTQSPAWQVFDGVTSTGNYSAGYMTSTPGSQVTLDLGPGADRRISRYRLWTSSYSDSGGTYRPTSWTLEASRDGSNWTTIDTYSGAAVPSGSYIERTLSSVY